LEKVAVIHLPVNFYITSVTLPAVLGKFHGKLQGILFNILLSYCRVKEHFWHILVDEPTKLNKCHPNHQKTQHKT
jgi:hypothetical protein